MIEFETLGRVTIDRDRRFAALHEFARPQWAAVNDITLPNAIRVPELDPSWKGAIERGSRPPQQIKSLAVIADPI